MLARGLVFVLAICAAPGRRCARFGLRTIARLVGAATAADRVYESCVRVIRSSDAAWRRRTVDGVYRVYRQADRGLRAISLESTRATLREWIRYEGFEHYERAKERGKGVLFATAHLGNWELSAFAHALLTEKMNIVVRPLDNPLMDELVETRRALSGNTLLSKRDFARSMLHALRDNEPVGILVDQNSAGDNAAFVPVLRQAGLHESDIRETGGAKRGGGDSGIRGVERKRAEIYPALLSARADDRRRRGRYGANSGRGGGGDPRIPGAMAVDSSQMEDTTRRRARNLLTPASVTDFTAL